MPRRIEIELTSSRDDGTWTWRAAGAREPKGTLDGSLLPSGASTGDVLRADAEFYLEGIEITSVLPPKSARAEPERIEIRGTERDEPLVTSSVTRDDRGDRRDRKDRGDRKGRRDDRGPRGDRTGREGPRRDGAQGDRNRGERGERGERRDRQGGRERPRRDRPTPPPMPAVERPKSKRLRAGKAHRKALLESLPEEQRPVAEQLTLGGLPAVRQAIEKQNAERKAEGQPEVKAQPLLDLAERLVAKVRVAEWRDRAEAAVRDLDVLDLRDLRSVVSAADAAARDQEAKELASTLREGLARRVEEEHAAWLAELAATLDVGRVVRALRVSSRPPKAGAPLPPDLAGRLVAATNESLTAEATPDRWAAVLDALAFSPVRDRVIPASLPTGELHPDLRATVARLATRLPKIAHIFEIAPDPTIPRPKPERRKQRPKKAAGARKAAPGAKGPDKAEQPAAEEPAAQGSEQGESPVAEEPVAEEPVAQGSEQASLWPRSRWPRGPSRPRSRRPRGPSRPRSRWPRGPSRPSNLWPRSRWPRGPSRPRSLRPRGPSRPRSRWPRGPSRPSPRSPSPAR
jgi:hypothetical protein